MSQTKGESAACTTPTPRIDDPRRLTLSPPLHPLPPAEDTFQQLCFDYGIELDDVTSEREMLRKEIAKAAADADGAHGGPPSGAAARLAAASEDVLYKIDIPANRYDMLCLEGIARALNIFRGRMAPVEYKVADVPPTDRVTITVKPETALIRPFIVAAVLRGVTFTPARYASFIDLQDRLHINLCRHRSLVAIGTHDLATLTPPFTYEALPPADITFRPLKQDKEWRADELLEHYAAHDLKLRRYVPLIGDSVVAPAVLDARRAVASLPPIINSAASAITLNTRDVFIECTATDASKARVVLNTVVAAFSEWCHPPFWVEPVDVTDALGRTTTTPDLAPRPLTVDADYIRGIVGVDLPADGMARLLSRMALPATAARDGSSLTVAIPPTRTDVLHACDVAEDVAIAHGYNNVPPAVASLPAFGGEAPLNALCESVRAELACAGWTEILTWALGPTSNLGPALRRPPPAAARVTGAATAEFEAVRTSLLPGALRTLGANRDAPLPVKLFEVGDVVLLDRAAGDGLAGGRWGDAPEPVAKAERGDAGPPPPPPPTTTTTTTPPPPHANGTGATNARRIVAIVCASEGVFESIHGLLNRVMQALGVALPPSLAPALGPGAAPDADKQRSKLGGSEYGWTPSSDPAFFPGRQAHVTWRGGGGGRVWRRPPGRGGSLWH